jgi:hypothetical protein
VSLVSQGRASLGCECDRSNVPVQEISHRYSVTVRGSRLKVEAQHAIIKALDRVARGFSRDPERPACRLLYRKSILTPLFHRASADSGPSHLHSTREGIPAEVRGSEGTLVAAAV